MTKKSNTFRRQPLHIVNIGGGLGNQMFLYAFGQAVKDVLFDVNGFNADSYRSFDLGLYDIDRKFASPTQVKQCLGGEIHFKNILPGFIRRFFHLNRHIYICTNRIKEKQINRYQPNLLDIKGNAYYHVCAQSEKYFKQFREKLLHDFTLLQPLDEQNKIMLSKIQNFNSVAVHIRRGDYLHKKSPFTALDKDYFIKAMEYIAARIENPHFFIFSSDMDWVRKNIKTNYPQTFVEINDEKHGYFDLELMRNCKHNIIANSTFSWWGAWLNTNPQKIVVAPKQWFLPTAAEYSGDIVPDEWIKM